MRRPWFLLSWLLLATALAAVNCVLSAPEAPPEMSRVEEVYRILEERSVLKENLDPSLLSQSAVRGLLESLDDPYASFLTPEQLALEHEDISGKIEGIGVEVGMRNGQITVIAPIKGTPADRAGIRSGDVILEVDSQPTAEITFLEIILTIRGPKGTQVELLIQRPDEPEPMLVAIVRDAIETQSVALEMLDGGVAYVALSGFLDNTDDALREELERAETQGATGLILDLRNNPGGLVSTTINIVSQFVDDGLVFYEIDGDGNRKDWEVNAGEVITDLPMVVLVNEFSASASEITAGALKSHGRATIIGATTFGKGSVNILQELSDNSGLFFSVAYWFTPEGVHIEGQGITPDIEISQPVYAEEDIQLQQAIEHLGSLALVSSG